MTNDGTSRSQQLDHVFKSGLQLSDDLSNVILHHSAVDMQTTPFQTVNVVYKPLSLNSAEKENWIEVNIFSLIKDAYRRLRIKYGLIHTASNAQHL